VFAAWPHLPTRAGRSTTAPPAFACRARGRASAIVFSRGARLRQARAGPGNRDWLSGSPASDGAFGCLVDAALPLAPPLRALLEGFNGEELWFAAEASFRCSCRTVWPAAFLAGLQSLLARLPVLGVEA